MNLEQSYRRLIPDKEKGLFCCKKKNIKQVSACWKKPAGVVFHQDTH